MIGEGASPERGALVGLSEGRGHRLIRFLVGGSFLPGRMAPRFAPMARGPWSPGCRCLLLMSVNLITVRRGALLRLVS